MSAIAGRPLLQGALTDGRRDGADALAAADAEAQDPSS
jgi:hypothetical protein